MAILMCRPEYFGIEYEINPWMNVAVEVNHVRAVEQWDALHSVYTELGESIALTSPQSGLPDMVFTANAAVVWRRRAVLSRFHHAERAGEERHWRGALEELDFVIHEMPADISFEGAGDALFVGDHLFQAWGFRTDLPAHSEVARFLDVESTSLQLVDPRFYHLDTCFCPLDDHSALIAPDAFAPESVELVRARVPRLLEVPREVAEGFACNAMPLRGRVISSTAVEAIRAPLADAGFEVVSLPVDEFMKSGGGVRCLSLPLDLGLD
ncbi:MAG: amidinotransferase [Candidatus Dormibacteraeota bacterium]|uniref:Amidinotransferase n=1 Tax=Candidatus Aeolococcus gillhamiae TaxID=3127015 RepID=A0A2W5Z7W4_9BACT|nr:amidinotransferase [Candidatus Dormibacteraeota bacterium]PZR81419.1 MAG: amidinotransferase [Candidatus Dormibacter sp. RRmetagenome_bin12]